MEKKNIIDCYLIGKNYFDNSKLIFEQRVDENLTTITSFLESQNDTKSKDEVNFEYKRYFKSLFIEDDILKIKFH